MRFQSAGTGSPTRSWLRAERGSTTPNRPNTKRTNPEASKPVVGDAPPR